MGSLESKVFWSLSFPTTLPKETSHMEIIGFHFLLISGILLMMSLCSEVHVYEYLPSVRQTELCHYHELYYDAACTLGAYHPLLYEKLLVQRLNTGAQGDLHRKGKVVLPGLRAVYCPAPNS